MYCKNKKTMKVNNKRAFNYMLLNKFFEKIQKKVDIFHYLKMLGKIENMKEFLLREKGGSILFDALCTNIYYVKVNKNYDCSFLTKEKKKINKIESILDYLTKPESKRDEFIIDKVNEVI